MCPSGGAPQTCGIFALNPLGNAAAPYTAKQDQGYGQQASYMYFAVECLNKDAE